MRHQASGRHDRGPCVELHSGNLTLVCLIHLNIALYCEKIGRFWGKCPVGTVNMVGAEGGFHEPAHKMRRRCCISAIRLIIGVNRMKRTSIVAFGGLVYFYDICTQITVHHVQKSAARSHPR
jgi:hypothetical protein